MQPGQTLKCLCLKIEEVTPFLRSVSYAEAAQRTTRLEWVEDTSGGLHYLYRALLGTFGTPGSAQVRTASEARLAEEVVKLTAHRIDTFFQRCEIGPEAVAKYLADQRELRDYCLKAIREVYADADGINAEVSREWGKSIVFLSRIKLASTVAVKVLGQIPGPGWAIGLGYDVVVGSIDDLSEAGQAKGVVVVASENAVKEGLKEGAGALAETAVDALNKAPTERELGQAFTRMRQLQDKLDRQLRTLSQRKAALASGTAGRGVADSARSLSRQVARNTPAVAAARTTVAKSAVKYTAAKAVSWAFVASDVIDAIAKHGQVAEEAMR